VRNKCHIHTYIHIVGLKGDYEDNHEIRGFIRCLTASSHVPVTVDDIISTFEQLIDTMLADERVNEVATYFENTYAADVDLIAVNITVRSYVLCPIGISL